MIAEPAHLEQMLGRLKLTAIRDQLDSLLDEAAQRELTLRETLTLFCEREIARKDERRIEMAMSIAKFPYVRDLAGFDFKAQPSLDPKQIRDLATGRFIANGETLLLLGPPGVGKTHLAVAIGRGAILAGYAVPVHSGDDAGGGACPGARRGAARGQAHAVRQAAAADRR